MPTFLVDEMVVDVPLRVLSKIPYLQQLHSGSFPGHRDQSGHVRVESLLDPHLLQHILNCFDGKLRHHHFLTKLPRHLSAFQMFTLMDFMGVAVLTVVEVNDVLLTLKDAWSEGGLHAGDADLVKSMVTRLLFSLAINKITKANDSRVKEKIAQVLLHVLTHLNIFKRRFSWHCYRMIVDGVGLAAKDRQRLEPLISQLEDSYEEHQDSDSSFDSTASLSIQSGTIANDREILTATVSHTKRRLNKFYS